MSLLSDEISKALPTLFDAAGDDVFIGGVPYRGIFEDDFYEDETGDRQELILSLSKDDIANVSVGDPVEINGANYTIRNIPNIDDVLVPVELHRA